MRGWQNAHYYSIPTSLSEYRADLPVAVNEVLQKAMAKNPHERYPTVQAFALDLLNASQEDTLLLDRPSLPVRNPAAQFRPAPGNVQPKEKAMVELQPFGVSLEDTPATEPIAIPFIPAPVKQASRYQEGNNRAPLHEAHTAIPKTARSRNRWLWCALALNMFIFIMLIIEYTLLAGRTGFSFEPLLTLCPVLIVGVLLAMLFKRIALTTLSGSLFCGIFYGMTNALLSLVACIVWYSFLLVVEFQPGAGGGLSGFFDPALHFVSDPRVVILLLLALWVSVTGGAVIGIFNIQGEDTTRLAHPEPQ